MANLSANKNQIYIRSNFVYFLLSLVPGIAHCYIGLTQRGVTIIFIAYATFYLLHKIQILFLLVMILSFMDCYNIRNRYYLGQKIVDSNSDIIATLHNRYVILTIIILFIYNTI